MPRDRLPGKPGVVISSTRSIRVVIVDDNPEFLVSATRLLEHQGASVVGVASTIAQALWCVQELQPDVTLVDVDLGGESGFELGEKLHDNHGMAPAPVILISMHAEQDLADMIEISPAIGFLAKSELSAGAISAILGHLAESHPEWSR
jgi:CheY-like chemotaxis protein